MKVYSGVEALEAPFSGSSVCLGNFDGLHLGHRELVKRTIEMAHKHQTLSVVFTFAPHPVQILAPEKQFKPLFPREDLLNQLREMGVDVVILQTFNASFAATTAEKFVSEYLLKPLNPRHVWVGPDFAFGRGRGGSVEILKVAGENHGFEVSVLPGLKLDGEVVSSSRIRQAVQSGDLTSVQKFLGRAFSVMGIVEAGAGRGRTIGFPTANFTPHDVMTPKRGVYVTRTWVQNTAYPSVTNVGGAPTFADTPTLSRIETHILDQNLELRGVQIRVEFISYLREERRFNSAAELVQQIQKDATAARMYWQKSK